MKRIILLISATILISCVFMLSCKKDKTDEAQTLKTYSLTNVKNALVKDAKCGIDLAHGKVYTITEGQQLQDSIDIAYGYMDSNSRYERVFLNIDYAGCKCGGSSYFSYGDTHSPGLGYSTYSVRNQTKLFVASSTVNFDSIASVKTKSALDKYFSAIPEIMLTEDAFFSSIDILVSNPYIFFETVHGKRGIIRVKPFVRNIATDYQNAENPISIDVIVEK
jgi:hypothetical protein